MHWIMMNERTDEHQISIDNLPPLIENQDLNFDYGNLISVNVPVIDVPYDLQSDEWMTDVIVVATRVGLLINAKVKTIFDALKITNIQYFPTRLIKSGTNEIDEDYCIANIIGKYKCVDFDKSELELFDDGDIEFIDKLVLNIGKQSDDAHIFRLAEFPALLVISDMLKNKIEEASVTGLKIYEPEEFSI